MAIARETGEPISLSASTPGRSPPCRSRRRSVTSVANASIATIDRAARSKGRSAGPPFVCRRGSASVAGTAEQLGPFRANPADPVSAAAGFGAAELAQAQPASDRRSLWRNWLPAAGAEPSGFGPWRRAQRRRVARAQHGRGISASASGAGAGSGRRRGRRLGGRLRARRRGAGLRKNGGGAGRGGAVGATGPVPAISTGGDLPGSVGLRRDRLRRGLDVVCRTSAAGRRRPRGRRRSTGRSGRLAAEKVGKRCARRQAGRLSTGGAAGAGGRARPAAAHPTSPSWAAASRSRRNSARMIADLITTSLGPPVITRCSTLSRRTMMSWRSPPMSNVSTTPSRCCRPRAEVARMRLPRRAR